MRTRNVRRAQRRRYLRYLIRIEAHRLPFSMYRSLARRPDPITDEERRLLRHLQRRQGLR
jgi:hypothetical protein